MLKIKENENMKDTDLTFIVDHENGNIELMESKLFTVRLVSKDEFYVYENTYSVIANKAEEAEEKINKYIEKILEQEIISISSTEVTNTIIK